MSWVWDSAAVSKAQTRPEACVSAPSPCPPLQDTYFLSSEECITAGHFQNKHPNICRLSPDGHFGSKFVTAVATGM